jgi:hypothetical protein
MCPLPSFLAAECQPFSSTDGLGNSLAAGNEHVSATEGVCVRAYLQSLGLAHTLLVCGVAVGADRAGVPFLPADFQPFSTTEGLVCVVATAAAAAAAGPCHCAVGHAVHVFRWFLIDLKLVNPAPGKKRRCLYEAELESVRAALQAERTLRAQLEVQLS